MSAKLALMDCEMNGIKKLNVRAKTNFSFLKRAEPGETLSSFLAGFLCILFFLSLLTWCHEIEKYLNDLLNFEIQIERENQRCGLKVISRLEVQ